MTNTFRIPKKAGTYADTLEAFGLANLLTAIFTKQAISHTITINDKGIYYEVISSKPITIEILDKLQYFQVVTFIKKNETSIVPENIGVDFHDYPLQRDLRKEKRAALENAFKNTKGGDAYKQQKRTIEELYRSERVAQPLSDEFDVFSQLISNPYAAFLKLYHNFSDNKAHFKDLIIKILNRYLSNEDQIPSEYAELKKAKKIEIQEQATLLQLLNPNQGKGLNKSKATGMSVGNLKGNWIEETMKVSGALNLGMICQLVKVGSSYDLKIFVPSFNNITLSGKNQILKSFKQNLKGNSPIKLDILNMLSVMDLFIQHNKEYRGKIRKTLSGLHSVYQKDLGQNRAVANIGFLETPDFIELSTEDSGDDWREIINEQKKILNGIDESKSGTNIGLLAFRNFLNGSNLNEYFKFHYWYATYLMHELSNAKQRYVSTNKIETLNKIFILMDISLKSITENEGFQAVAKAIRKSTVSLQYTPKDQRKFDVQYGLAQKIQNKSNSKEDLISFVSEFIAKYNSDTARQYEKTKQALRANVKDQELHQFYELADKVTPKTLGAMLAAYGFALNKKEKTDTEES